MGDERAGRDLRREDFVVLRPVPTRWADQDNYGHINNVAYYAYFDTVVNAYLMEATGSDIRMLDAIGLVVETSCQYYSELHFPQELSVGLGLERLGRSSVVYTLAIFAPDRDEPAAVGRFVHVYVDRVGRDVAPVPDSIREAIARLVPVT